MNRVPDFLDRRRRVEKAISEYLRCESAGRPMARDVWLNRHSELEAELQEFLEDHAALGLAFAPLRPTQARVAPPPKKIGDYELLEVIGRGGMGVVYKARQTSLRRTVALKMVLHGRLSSKESIRRFQNEAESAAKLRHPNIVAIHDVGRHKGVPYFSMDYIEGRNLSEIVRRRPLAPHRAAVYARAIAEAIHYAHAQGVLHRDLKPSNILIDANDAVHVTDFGLAKQLDGEHTMTETGQILGTAGYMPPEQAEAMRENIGPASDVYSIGAVLYELLTGRPPFQSDTVWETLRHVREQDPVSPRKLNPDVPRDLETVCLKCLRKSPGNRYPSAADLAADLDRFLVSQPVEAKPTSQALRMLRWGRRHFAPIVATASLLLLVMFLAFWSGKKNPDGNGDGPNPIHPNQLANHNDDNHNDPLKPVDDPPENNAREVKPIEIAALGQQIGKIIDDRRKQKDEEPDERRLPARAVLPNEGKLPKDPGPAAPTVLAEANPSIQAYSGKPFGVCKITVSYTGKRRPLLLPDQTVWLHEQNRRSLYPVFVRNLPAENLGDGKHKTLTAYCLFTGEEPLRLRVTTEDTFTKSFDSMQPRRDVKNHAGLLREWWAAYNASPVDSYLAWSEHPMAEIYLKTMLARRLKLPAPKFSPNSPLTSLLGDNYKAIGRYFHLLLGTESIRAALQHDTLLRDKGRFDRANVQIPTSVAPPPVAVPKGFKPLPVEEIAQHVPEECFYVRCRSYENYRWFRRTIEEWGGNLNRLIAMSSVDYGLRRRMEQQLALKETDTMRMFADGVISDMAIIGTDAFFREGAAFGVLFRVNGKALAGKAGQALQTMIRRPRAAALRNGAIEKTVKFHGRDVSFLHTSDNTVRSFYVIDGDYHLVTTSSYIAKRFLAAGKGDKPLAKLDQFRYARSKKPANRNDVAFIYLSDPFFRNLVSARYRVEMTRRVRAQADLQTVELARLAAAAEGKNPDSVDDLIGMDLLPAQFAIRPDGSSPQLKNNRVTDSLRGAAGSFLPVPDVEFDRVTASEAVGYKQFAREYRGLWQRTDPVIIAISKQKLPKPGQERIVLDVTITPYARTLYQMVEQYARLVIPTRKRMAELPGDTLAVEGNLNSMLIRAAIRDVLVPYTIRHGIARPMLKEEGKFEERLLPLLRGYIASNSGLLDALAFHKPNVDREGYYRVRNSKPVVWGRIWNYGKQWAALALNKKMLKFLADKLKVVNTARAAQLRVRLQGLSETHLGDFLRAVAYSHSRRISAGNARFLHQLMQQFQLEPDQAQKVAEQRLLHATLHCPLGGEYKQRVTDSGAVFFTGTGWTTRSAYAIRDVPAKYRFEFLDWLQRLDIEFSLSRDTLSTRIALDIQHDDGKPKPAPLVRNKPISLQSPNKKIPDEVWAMLVEWIHTGRRDRKALLRDDKIVDGLLAVLETNVNQSIQNRAALLLASRKSIPAQFMPRLRKLLADERIPAVAVDRLYELVIDALPMSIKKPNGIAAWLKIIDSKEETSLRILVLKRLWRLGPKGMQYVATLQKLLLDEKQPPEMRFAVAAAMSHLPIHDRAPVVPSLTKLVRHQLPAQRRQGIVALGLVGVVGPERKDASDAIIAALNDPDATVKLAAVETLSKLNSLSTAAVPNLISALKSPDVNVRLSVVKALGKKGKSSAKAGDALIRLALEDSDTRVRTAAAAAVAQSGTDNARKAASKFGTQLKSRDYAKRQIALAAFANMGKGSAARFPFSELLRISVYDNDSQNRQYAIQAINNMERRWILKARTAFNNIGRNAVSRTVKNRAWASLKNLRP